MCEIEKVMLKYTMVEAQIISDKDKNLIKQRFITFKGTMITKDEGEEEQGGSV